MTTMLDALQLAAQVADDTALRIFSDVYVDSGCVIASNGSYTVRVDCPDLKGEKLLVDAQRFFAAIKNGSGTPKLKTVDGKLKIKNGRLSATLALKDAEAYPVMQWQGQFFECPTGFIEAIERVLPFTTQDKGRPWAQGVQIKGSSAYATNGVVLVRSDFKHSDLEPFILPIKTCEMLVTLGAPEAVSIEGGAAMFRYKDKALLRTSFVSAQWPNIDKLLIAPATIEAVPDGLLDAVQQAAQFCPDPKYLVIILRDGKVSTNDGDSQATIEVNKLNCNITALAEPLVSVLQIASGMNFSAYPAPMPFVGKEIVGVMTGIKL